MKRKMIPLRTVRLALVIALAVTAADVLGQEMLKLKPEGQTLADIQRAVQESGGRLGFLYFTTDWCGWCKKLQAETFSDPDFIAFAERHFVPFLVNAEKATGPGLRTLYKVQAYPTVVVVDGQGRMVDLIVGYKAPKPYRAELERIVRGEGTLQGLQAAWEKDPSDAAVGLRLAEKHFAANEYEAARAVYEKVLPALADVKSRSKAVINLASIESLRGERERAAELLGAGLREGLFDEDRDRVLYMLGNIRFQSGDSAGVLAALDEIPASSRYDQSARLYIVLALARQFRLREAWAVLEGLWRDFGGDPGRLYTICWYLKDNKVFPQEALTWGRKAIELSEAKSPHIIHLVAELLLEMGRAGEAVEAGERAVAAADAKSQPLYRTYLAVLKRKAGDRKGAEAIVSALDPMAIEDATTLNNMAWTLLESGFALTKALAWAERAVRLSQFLDDNVLSTYAELLQRAGRTREAVEALEKAMAITTYEYRRKEYAEKIERLKKESGVFSR